MIPTARQSITNLTMVKLLIGAGVAIGALGLLSAKKVADISHIVENLDVQPHDVAGLKLDWSAGTINFKIKARILNGSDLDLNFSTLGLITMEQLHIFNIAAKQIATANVYKNDISIPARGGFISDWIPVTISMEEAVGVLMGGLSAFDPSTFDYKIKLNVKGFGSYTI